MRRLWILFVIFAVVMLPAAFTTVAIWVGVSEYTLAWNWLLMGLMLLPVLLRCFYLPQIMCVLNGLYLLWQGVHAILEKKLMKELVIGAVTFLILLLSFSGLEMFFRAMMGI